MQLYLLEMQWRRAPKLLEFLILKFCLENVVLRSTTDLEISVKNNIASGI